MKYLKQFLIILIFSFFGEVLHYFIPLPIPASIYGIVLLLVCLLVGIVKLEQVEETSLFLIEIMPVMFIPASVSVLESWNIIQTSWLTYAIMIVVTTVIVMVISGRVTQFVIRKDKKEETSC